MSFAIREPLRTPPSVSVYRNMPEHPIPAGQTPAWTDGMWFAYCIHCGHLGEGPAVWCRTPELAQRRAIVHAERAHWEVAS